MTLVRRRSICVFTHGRVRCARRRHGQLLDRPVGAAASIRNHRLASTTRGSVAERGRPNETRAIAVPAGAAAVAINVTITEPAASGFVTVFPCQADLPVVSNLNYVAGQVVANLVQIGVVERTGLRVQPGAHAHRDRPAGNLRRERRRACTTKRSRRRDSSTPAAESARCSDVWQWTSHSLGAFPSNAPVATTSVPGNVRGVDGVDDRGLAAQPRAGPRSGRASSRPLRRRTTPRPSTSSPATSSPTKPSPRPSWPAASTSARSPPPPPSTSSTSPAGS